MRKNTVAIVCFFILALLISCGGGGGNDGGGKVEELGDSGTYIGPEGGEVEITDVSDDLYGVKIQIPEGALDSDIEITISKSNNNLASEEGMLPSGVAVDLGPDGTKFDVPVKVTIPYFDEDNDGILDGTNIPEEEISPMIYEKEMGVWLRKRVLSQDVATNTVTFETMHFSNYKAWVCDRESYMAKKDVIFTIDGLSFKNTLYSYLDGDDLQRPSYLKRAFNESMNLENNFEVISYAGLKVDYIGYNIYLNFSYHVESEGDSWSGNASQTGDLLEDLIENIEKEYMYAKRGGKKFIIVGHSWGTVLTELGLMYATDENDVAVKPDLVLTLSAPRGSENVSYEEEHLFVDDTVNRTKVFFSQPLMQSNLDAFAPDPNPDDYINAWTVDYAESYISGYATDWIEYCQLRKAIFKINPNEIQFGKWVNYYFQGDIISGPISPTLGLPIEDRTVDYGYDERRNLSNTKKYHALTSLDEGVEPEGAWNEYLYEDYDFVVNAAIPFRETVKCDILTELYGPQEGNEYCYSQDPCVDVDGDGYFAGHECGTEVDCNDSDPSIHPGASEICGDGIDQNCNGSDLACSESDIGSDWTQATAAAQWGKRWGHSSVVFDNKMWVLGGADEGGAKRDVWYSSDGVNWTIATAVAQWSARREHSSIVFDGKIWVLGGIGTEWYDRKNDIWFTTDGANWTQATSTVQWSGRGGHASIIYDGKIWVIGGYGSGNIGDAWYSSDGVHWMQTVEEQWWWTSQGFPAVVFDGKMWYLGARRAEAQETGVWYSSDGANWSQAVVSPWGLKMYPTSVVFDGRMYVIGGWDSVTGEIDGNVWYSSDGANWTQAAETQRIKRAVHTSLVFDGKVWVLGGMDDDGSSSCYNDVWYSTLGAD